MQKLNVLRLSGFRVLCMATAVLSLGMMLDAGQALAVKLKMGTVWQTSGSYPGYVAVRDAIVKGNPDFQVAVVESGGAVMTEEATAKGQVDFGNSDAPDLYMKYNGIEKYQGQKPAKNLRILWVNQHRPNTIFVLEKSGIKSIEELDGQSYGVLIGSIVGDTFRYIMDLNGIKPKYFPGEPGALSDAVENNKIWGYCKSGDKESSITRIALSEPITLLPLSDEVLEKVRKANPAYRKSIIKAGSYPGQTEDVQTWTSASYISGRDDIPEDVVYKMIKAVHENAKDIRKAAGANYFQLVEQLTQATVDYASIPLHPGSIKYLREQGVDIPDELIPPEMKM